MEVSSDGLSGIDSLAFTQIASKEPHFTGVDFSHIANYLGYHALDIWKDLLALGMHYRPVTVYIPCRQLIDYIPFDADWPG